MGQRPAAGDVALAAALTALTLGNLWVSGWTSTPMQMLYWVAALTATSSVLWRRSSPVVSAVVAYVLLSGLAVALADPTNELWIYPVILVVPYSAGRHGSRHGAVAVLAVALIFDTVVGIHESWGGWWNYLANYAFVAILTTVIPWTAGHALARRQQQSAERATTAVDEERRRIARELHDVVGHALGVIAVQAGAERATLPSGAPVSSLETLATIEHTARQALTEMRRMLTVMRVEGEPADPLSPQPSLSQLDTLLNSVGGAGLATELRVEGEPVPLAPGVDLSAYRIVQEALTNTLRHAGHTQTRVTVRYLPGAVELEVVDNGTRQPRGTPNGFGLAGMMERVALYGGSLSTGVRSEGGYAVKVRLPTGEATQ
jgi:signal transduction histidine kinase